MANYDKRPKSVQAWQWTGINDIDAAAFTSKHNLPSWVTGTFEGVFGLIITRPDGNLVAEQYDFVVKPFNSNYRPINPINFNAKYSLVECQWIVDNASFNQSFSVSTQDTKPTGLDFKPDGSKMFVTGNNNDNLLEYALSTPWDISTSSYTGAFAVGAQDTKMQGHKFKPDGTKVYIVGSSTNKIYEYNLSVAWNISSMSYSKSLSVSAKDTAPQGIYWKSDGLSFWVVGTQNSKIYEYKASTVWDISTGSFVQDFDIGAKETSPQDIIFHPEGNSIFVVGGNNKVYEGVIYSPWNISTITFGNAFDVSSKETDLQGVYFKSCGDKMYIIGKGSDQVHEYDLI